MTQPRIAGVPAAEMLAFAAAVVFIVLGLTLLREPETAVLRLAVWGWPAWPVRVVAAVEILAGLLLLRPVTRLLAAWVLIGMSGVQLVVEAIYGEGESVLRASLQILVLAAVVYLNRGRAEGR